MHFEICEAKFYYHVVNACHWSFSVIGVRFCKFCIFYRITKELKNPGAKWYINWEVNPGTDFPLTFMSCMLLSQLIPLSAGNLSPLDLYVVML